MSEPEVGPRPQLVDSSVWVDWLRGTPGAAAEALDSLLSENAVIVTTEPILMELYAGASSDIALERLQRVLTGLPMLPVDAALDFHHGAALYREVRRRGRTVRKLFDCLIAAVALRNDATLIHKDSDFDAIAETMKVHWTSLTGR